jgi:hypothetical protein
MHKLELSVSHVTENEISLWHCIDLVELKKFCITYADRLRIAEVLQGSNPPHVVRPRYQNAPKRLSVKLKNSMCLITCNFKFCNAILAEFSGGS